MWPCRHARKHFSDAIDGEKLPLLTAWHVAIHRAICPFCRPFEKSLRATIAAGKGLRDLPFEEPDEDAPKPDAPKTGAPKRE